MNTKSNGRTGSGASEVCGFDAHGVRRCAMYPKGPKQLMPVMPIWAGSAEHRRRAQKYSRAPAHPKNALAARLRPPPPLSRRTPTFNVEWTLGNKDIEVTRSRKPSHLASKNCSTHPGAKAQDQERELITQAGGCHESS